MRIRSCFAITGKIRFLSHLDLLKVMERALKRAQLPVTFSQGFNPHPQIAFATAKSVGLASTCEYFDVELDQTMDPSEFQRRLQEKCPHGIEILQSREIPSDARALMALINSASYQVLVQTKDALTGEELDKKIAELFARTEIKVERISPKKRKEFDIRPGIFSLTYSMDAPQRVLLEMDLSMGNLGNVRPHEVVVALGLDDYEILDITRVEMFIGSANGAKITDLWQTK
ncbi:TIGR03936 family radical SAM-associated protein [Dehalobacterium formicoaceticum]|uniref:TIGR03936 family radical SAM-associated protein n=1 Tax=Dehalobacterium formicoaceticum TaxID=51515 RepID=A0ABT1Y2B4_9FIRM|nr:TIGR03936 family radical SAM-associated protein [Dehalobacterium formicoaceticum]MCR6544995.1 TIGR03936 family radical SAM-associated protein [Dehalobacterium formicoaceticum]